MSKFENEQEKKVREILMDVIFDYVQDIKKGHGHLPTTADKIMLRIRPYLKVQKKWMGDAL